jgi:hypothetical protein
MRHMTCSGMIRRVHSPSLSGCRLHRHLPAATSLQWQKGDKNLNNYSLDSWRHAADCRGLPLPAAASTGVNTTACHHYFDLIVACLLLSLLSVVYCCPAITANLFATAMVHAVAECPIHRQRSLCLHSCIPAWLIVDLLSSVIPCPLHCPPPSLVVSCLLHHHPSSYLSH